MDGFDWAPVITAAAAIAGGSLAQFIGIRAQAKSQREQWKQEESVERARWEHDRLEQREQRSREAGELTLERGLELLELLTPLTAFSPNLMSDEVQDLKGKIINSVYLVRDERIRRAVYMALRAMLTSMVCPPSTLREGEAWRESQRLAGAMVNLVAEWLRGDNYDENYTLIEQAHIDGEERFTQFQESQRARLQSENSED